MTLNTIYPAIQERQRPIAVSYEASFVRNNVENCHIVFVGQSVFIKELYKQQLKKRFDFYNSIWKNETIFLSSISEITNNSAYRSIVGLGQEVIPFIIEDLKINDSHWFYALEALTGAASKALKKGDKVKIRFINCSLYSLNTCNDEGYYYGQYRTNPNELPWGEFYEIKSGLDRNMPNPIVKIADDNSDKKHFIFFFKDETFECIASEYELVFYNEKAYDLAYNKIYKIFLDDKEIGTSLLEKADAPMGVVIGKLNFIETKFGYDFLKKYCENNQIELTYDYPENKMISTMSIQNLKITNDEGIEIKGVGNQISGMDNEEYQIEIFGIPYPFYEEEFPHHVADYKTMFDEK